jgi:hypothetical protein
MIVQHMTYKMGVIFFQRSLLKKSFFVSVGNRLLVSVELFNTICMI